MEFITGYYDIQREVVQGNEAEMVQVKSEQTEAQVMAYLRKVDRGIRHQYIVLEYVRDESEQPAVYEVIDRQRGDEFMMDRGE